MIERRQFITLLGGAAAGWPLAARAQQPCADDWVSSFRIARSDGPLSCGISTGVSGSGLRRNKNVAIDIAMLRDSTTASPCWLPISSDDRRRSLSPRRIPMQRALRSPRATGHRSSLRQ